EHDREGYAQDGRHELGAIGKQRLECQLPHRDLSCDAAVTTRPASHLPWSATHRSPAGPFVRTRPAPAAACPDRSAERLGPWPTPAIQAAPTTGNGLSNRGTAFPVSLQANVSCGMGHPSWLWYS